MSYSVYDALEDRKKRQQKNQQQTQVTSGKGNTMSVEDALKARKERVTGNIGTVSAGIFSRFESLANTYNSSIGNRTIYGTAASDLYDSRSNDRLEAASLLKKVEAYRSYLGDDVADQLISSITQIRGGYDSLLDLAKYETKEEYDTAVRYSGYQQKYQGSSYSELKKLLGEMEDGEEKQWLSQYAPTVKTDVDYGMEIGEINTALYPLETSLEEMQERQQTLQQKRTAYSRSHTISQEQKDAVEEELEQLNAQIADTQAQIEALKGQKWTLENEREYRFLNQNEDWAENSQVAHDEATAGFGIGFGDKYGVWIGKGDPVYDYINFLDESKDEHMASDSIDGGSTLHVYDYMTDEERASYNYLYNTQGKDAAKEYLDYLEYTLNQRIMGEAQEYATAFADEHPILASAVSVPANLMSGIGALDVAGQNVIKGLKEDFTGEYAGPVDYNRGTMAPTIFTTTTRGTVAQNIADSTGTIQIDTQKHPILSKLMNGKSLGDVYQLGMSMVDSAAVAALSPYIGSAGTYLLGGSAASQGILDAVANGATDEQALTMGILNGAFEVLFEKYELENLLGADSNMLKALLNQALTEGIGEGSTTLANNIADFAVMGENSNLLRTVAAYMEQGLSQEDAMRQALLDSAIQLGWDAVGGMLSGSIMGAAASPIENVANRNAQAKSLFGADPGALVTKSLEINPNNRYAQKMQSRLDAGKDLSGGQLYHMAHQNEKALTKQDMTSIQEAAANRLTELGETGNVETIAAALAKEVAGKKLSKAERQAIDSSSYGKRVSNELNAQNIRSGGYSSQWVSNIGTKRINPLEYNDPLMALAMETAGADTSRTNPAAPGQESVATEGNLSGAKMVPSYEVSEDGKTHLVSDPEKTVTVKSIASVEDGKMTLQLDDGSTVDADDVSFGNEGQALVYSTVADMNVSLETANVLVKAFDPSGDISAPMYALDIQEAYRFGEYNYPLKAMENDPYAAVKKQAWNEGRIAAIKASDSKQSDVEATFQKAQKTLKQAGKEVSGDYHAALEEGITALSLSESQKASYHLADQIAQAAKVNIQVYVGKTGEQGYYDAKTDQIHLNLNATDKSRKSMMAFTLGHELVHRAKKGSPKKYQAFADFLIAEYGKQGSNVDEMIAQELEAAKDFGIKMTRDEALEEVICDACQRMLLDTDAGKKLAEFGAESKQNKSFLEDLKRWIMEFMEKLREIFAGVEPDSIAAQEFAKFEDGVKQILADMYVDMTIDAGVKLSTIQAVVKENAEAISSDEIITDGAVVTDGNEIKYSIKSMKADIAEGQMFEDLKTYCGWTQKQVNELRTNLKDLVEYMTPFRDILDMNETYGREGRRFSPYKPNSDPLYKISMDFSTLCSKRLLTQYVIENLQLRENRPMGPEEQMAIRDMLNEYRKVEKGLQVACAMCYVEAARLKSPKQISKWIADPAEQMKNFFADKNPEFAAFIKEKQGDFKESRGYDRNATKKDMSAKDVKDLNRIRPRVRSQYQLTAEEAQIVERAKALPASTYLTAGNLAELSETEPVIYAAYTAFVRTATRSKRLETDEPYYYGDSKRDNGNGITVSDSFIEAVNRENGMRFSSWSDWRIQHMLDYITAVIDNSVRGAAMHGYTKFGEEVRVLGKTGMMFNMSGVAGTQTGLNEDGSLSFSPTESIDVNEAIQLREEFPETAGLQCIGVGDDHIRALLRSDIIDYVIPYHVSGLNAGLRAMANIHGWADYTTTQHAAIDKSVKLENAADKEHWHEEPVFSEFFVGYDTGMTGIEAMRASADRYVQMCKDRGLKPKFEQFLKEDNYWKLLIDRKMINQKTGKLIRQRPVTPTFDFKTIREVVDRHVQNYDSGLEARALNHIVENWDSIPKRIRDLKKQGGKTTKKVSKAVDTLANETLAAQPKGTEGSRKFSLPKKDSDGNRLTEDQVEFFEDSKVRDEDGNLYVLYHGSRSEVFTEFDVEEGVWLTPDQRYAEVYAEMWHSWRDEDQGQKGLEQSVYADPDYRLYKMYANITNPLDLGEINDEFDRSQMNRLAKLLGVPVSRIKNIAFHDGYQTVAFVYEVTRDRDFIDIAREKGYDGFAATEKGKKTFCAFNAPNQVKLTTNEVPSGFNDIRYSLPKGNNPYTYDALISKPDMVVTSVGGNVPKDRAELVRMAKQNAAEVGKTDPKTGSVSVYVKDIGRDVGIGRDGLKHSLDGGRMGVNAPVLVKVGDILSNSIRINELTPREDNIDESYVLIGVARNADNELYVVRSVVNRYTHKLVSVDALYAVNAKKEPAALLPLSAGKTALGTDSTISIAELLDYVNQYFPDILPEEVLKHYGHDSRPKGKLGEDALYKLPVGEDTSPRALLANAFEGVVQNDIERRNLQEYQSKVDMLNTEEAKLQDLRREIHELSFAKGKRDTKRITELQFEANHTANRIATLDKMLLRFEASAPLQNILKREKEMVRKRERDRVKAAADTYRKKTVETMEKREAKIKLQKLVLDTAKWISYPKKDDVKCPDMLKAPYADFLNGIDMSSQRLAKGGDPTKNDLKLTSAMDSLATALERITMAQDPNQETTTVLDAGYLDLPAGFVQKLRDMTESIKAMMVEGDYVINSMTAQEVRQLSQMIRTLNHAIKEVSTLYANLRFANVEALGDDSMGFMDDLGEIEKTSGMTDFVEWDNALPYYAFRRFGKGGESIFEGLMDAQDKLAFLAQQIFDFQKKTWTEKEAKAWSEDTHTIDLPGEGKLTLTTADAMSIYCLSRRKQGLQHLLGGGTRVMGIQKGSKKAKDSRSILSIQDIDAINSSLTDRQKEVAESIQEFMSTVCSDWGNEISMKRFLTREFNEKNYFPIESNDENLPTKDPAAQQSDLFRLLNISATKPLDPRANNEVIVRNIFDVFTGHASDMARLNAFGLPLLDYMKWLNYREKAVNEEGQIKVRGVRKSMERAFGTAAKSYVLNLVKDVNGRASDGGDPSILMKWMRTAKTASVGSSLRVATLQITSYPRAALVLSPKSLALGLTKKPKIDMAKKYCGIALWKSFGFYDTNISRSIEDQMKGVTDVRQKIIELSLKGAEIGDAVTWGAMWNACEYEVAATEKFKIGSEEFYQEVGKKLREVVYATQVVDSTLTRSQIMRSKRGMAQEAAAFMSEPTLSANILMDAGFQFDMEKRRIGSAKAAWKNTGKYVGRALAVYSIGQLAAALLEGFWDAWRDDEDEEFWRKWVDAFVENLFLDLVPFNKIPIVSDVFEAVLAMFDVGFYSSDRMSTTWLTQAVSAVEAWKDALGGNSSSTIYNALYKSMRAVSSFFGVSISGVMREGVALWNNTAGAYDSTLKIRTYEPSKADKAEKLLDAIIDGNDRRIDSLKKQFDDEEAMESALRAAIKERYLSGEFDKKTTRNYLVSHGGLDIIEAHWKVDEWDFDKEKESGDEYGKYDDFYEAVNTGTNLDQVIKEYTDNGVELKTLRSQITSHFKPEYLEMSASDRASIKGSILNAMVACGVDREDAEYDMKEWDFEAENGFAYSDRKTAYLNGEITSEELRRALIEFGGYEAEDADAQIQVYDWIDLGYENATVSNVKKYNEFCKPAGVPIDAYLQIIEFSNNADNDTDPETGKKIAYSAVKKVMAQIDNLSISSAQKTAIARSLWKESTIEKYKLW